MVFLGILGVQWDLDILIDILMTKSWNHTIKNLIDRLTIKLNRCWDFARWTNINNYAKNAKTKTKIAATSVSFIFKFGLDETVTLIFLIVSAFFNHHKS